MNCFFFGKKVNATQTIDIWVTSEVIDKKRHYAYTVKKKKKKKIKTTTHKHFIINTYMTLPLYKIV